MTNGLSYKSKQFFFVLIKLGIVAFAFYFIYVKLMENDHLSFYDFKSILNKSKVFSLKNISFLLLLTIFNWFFEILKWQKLTSIITQISFLKSMEQSLGSLTASLFTPNRIGEYGAKAIYFPKDFRKKIMLLNLIGNMAQMSITIVLGILGLITFNFLYNPEIYLFRLLAFIGILLTLLVFSIFIWRNNKLEIKGFSLSKIKYFLEQISPKIKFQILMLSTLRYLVFSYQFFFLMSLFEIELGYLESMSIISSMYILSSVIPSIFIFDVVVKSGVAVYLFSFVGVDEIIVLSITTLMWLFNFVLPSILGSYHVLNFNPRTEG